MRQTEVVVARKRNQLAVGLPCRRSIRPRRGDEAAPQLPSLERRELVARDVVE
jgi:hypothetical protein